jgi:hypothetical protein
MIEVLHINNCQLNNRNKNFQLMINGLIDEKDYRFIYKNCGLITTYHKKDNRHSFSVKNLSSFFSRSKKNTFQLQRGIPKSE